MKFQVGDKVAYSVQFLRSIGMSHSEMARGRGIITEVKPFGEAGNLIKIKWVEPAGIQLPEKVLDCNLAKIGPNRRFANVD